MSGPCHSLYGEAVLLALHSLPHSVVVARLDHLGYQLQEGVMEGVRSEVVVMAIPVLLGVNQFSPLCVVTPGPVVPCTRLPKHEVVRPE